MEKQARFAYNEVMKIVVEKLDPEAKIPTFAYDGDAGADLFSVENQEILPGETTAIKTGIRVAIPKGYGGFIWDKSGLARNHRLTTLAGVIDSNYRGEIQVVIANIGTLPYHVEKGAKIAQLIIAAVETPEIEVGQITEKTERGEKGFGSSGN